MIKHFRKTLTMFLSFYLLEFLLPQSIFGALGPGQTFIQSGIFINFSSWALLTLKYTHKLKQTRTPVASGLKGIPPRSTGERKSSKDCLRSRQLFQGGRNPSILSWGHFCPRVWPSNGKQSCGRKRRVKARIRANRLLSF